MTIFNGNDSSVTFAPNAVIDVDFSSKFEFGGSYDISKLITDQSGKRYEIKSGGVALSDRELLNRLHFTNVLKSNLNAPLAIKARLVSGSQFGTYISIGSFTVVIYENQSTFNGYGSGTNTSAISSTSHLIIEKTIYKNDGKTDSKVTIDTTKAKAMLEGDVSIGFGSNFEYDKSYKLSSLILNSDDKSFSLQNSNGDTLKVEEFINKTILLSTPNSNTNGAVSFGMKIFNGENSTDVMAYSGSDRAVYDKNGNLLIDTNGDVVGNLSVDFSSAYFKPYLELGNANLTINESASSFSTTKSGDSHIVINGDYGDKSLYLAHEKFIGIHLGELFEIGKDYDTSKIAYDASGNPYTIYTDISSTTQITAENLRQTSSSLFQINGSGNSFAVSLVEDNIVSENLLSNTIFQVNSQMIGHFSQIRHSAFSPFNNARKPLVEKRLAQKWQKKQERILKYEKAKKATNDVSQDLGVYALDSNNAESSGKSSPNIESSVDSSIESSSDIKYNVPNDMYFFISPFVSYDAINDGIGFDGISSRFSAGLNWNLGDTHTLGFHLGLVYSNLKGSGNVAQNTLDTSISSLGLLLGLHYKIDLPLGFYTKILGDAMYISNDINSTINNLGNKTSLTSFGTSAYIGVGKDFVFDDYGDINVEIGANYQGLQNANLNGFNYESQNDNMINLAYINAGIGYYKIFDNGLGFMFGGGAKWLVNNADSAVSVADRNFTYRIGLDKISGIANASFIYLIENDTQIELNYIGSFGGKIVSNAGFFHIRVWW